jgi:hypothetical protein
MVHLSQFPATGGKAVPNHDNAKLIELARYLLGDDPSLIEEVRLAIDRKRCSVPTFRAVV